MFENLSDRLSKTLRNISGKGRLTEDNIKETLREVRMALLEADVALPVVREFIAKVKESALGEEVNKSLTPGQEFLKIVQRELEKAMGEANESLNLATQPPAVILMAGLQGAGKTTSVGKLAKFLRERHKKKVLVVSADVYRPAAIKQLETLAQSVGVDFFPSDVKQKPVEIAKAFNEALPLTGVILTKVDGDARGGAALSIRQITGKPIKFLGVGEKTEALEPFHPDRVASRILGMGDVLSLIEDLERSVDREKAEKMAQKFKKGDDFTLDDFREQLREMKKMGGMMSMLEKLPGAKNLPDHVKNQVDDKMFIKMEAIINSMTLKERANPDIIKGSRRRRIALGSGTQVQDVNKLLKQFDEMQRMMKKMRKGGMAKMMRGMQGLMGGGGLGGLGGLGGMFKR